MIRGDLLSRIQAALAKTQETMEKARATMAAAKELRTRLAGLRKPIGHSLEGNDPRPPSPVGPPDP